MRSPNDLSLFAVRDFDHFVDRTMGGIRKMGTSDTDMLWNNMLLKLCGNEWRQVPVPNFNSFLFSPTRHGYVAWSLLFFSGSPHLLPDFHLGQDEDDDEIHELNHETL